MKSFVRTVLFENTDGGRVAVTTQSLLDAGSYYCNTNRREELEAIFDYLSFGKLPIRLKGDGVYPQLFRYDSANQICAGFFNLSMDTWQHAEMKINLSEHDNCSDPELLMPDGTLRTLPVSRRENTIVVSIPYPVDPGKNASSR